MSAPPARLAVIPARLGSTRLPRKALLRESGKYLFQHVAERALAAGCFDAVILATDAEEIAAAARAVGVEARLTSPDLASGTDRVLAVAASIPAARIVVNLQGDEPEMEPRDLARLVEALETGEEPVVTLATPFRDGEDPTDPNAVKVVVSLEGEALYFSRAPIPFLRGAGRRLRHLGVYGFLREALEAFAGWPRSPLEEAEGLEQLRLLEHGIPLRVLTTDCSPRGIDTRADYDGFLGRLRAKGGSGWRSTSS
ncbi:MAG: 3-deoxy-manno-octulosonate cytidylyltransferase [Planctomycetes bacterium]|nr:3-deoxy-manno-octulosonate cytidylyltransferase [Planctomycetota bacterium]